MTNLEWWETWTPELAYVLGFAFADGSVASDRNNRLSLAQKDRDFLLRVLSIIPSVDRYHLGRIKQTGVYQLRLSVPNIRSILFDYGVVPNKTENGFWPRSMPKDMTRHYIRGYFDGDGYAGLVPSASSKRGVVTFCCHLEPYLSRLANELGEMGLSPRVPHKNSRKGDNYVLAYRTKGDVLKLYELFYRDSTFHMERKKQRFEMILDYYKGTYPTSGSGQHIAKITEGDVREIRRLYRTKAHTQKEIGVMFGINDRNVSAIVNGKAWRQVI